MAAKADDKVSYQEFREEWLSEIEDSALSPLDKGRRFAAKLITQWLGISTDDDDFVITDGSGDGGIDVAYLHRADNDVGDQDTDAAEGDTWYLVQSKYGTAFAGSDTLFAEGNKVIETLLGENQHLSEDSRQLLRKLNLFLQQASDSDRIVLVFATTDPINQQDRGALERVKLIGREQVSPNFNVEEVSLRTIWEELDDGEIPKLTVALKGQFVEKSSDLLVGTVPLTDLFEFLKSYRSSTGSLDQLYDKNVRRFLGARGKVNKAIRNTLNDTPERFGLYNNGITLVVSLFSLSRSSLGETTVNMHDPYVVNGCQTTRTIWDVLDTRLNSGGTGNDENIEAWKERLNRGSVVTKIVRSEEAEIMNITRFTNSQNSVREQDFIALNSGFQDWAKDMERNNNIFLEIQRGGIDSRKAYEKQHPDQNKFDDYVNAFDLLKVYGAGWLSEPGTAFSKNAAFAPTGSTYKRIMNRQQSEPPFGAKDLYAAYKIKCEADKIGFGRRADRPSRRLSRHLFYYILLRMLENVIFLTPEYHQPPVVESVLTDAVIKLTFPSAEDQLNILRTAAVTLLDQYLTLGGQNSVDNETEFNNTHNRDLNRFLKSDNLGAKDYSPLLVDQLELSNRAFATIPMQGYEGNPTQREFVAQALVES